MAHYVIGDVQGCFEELLDLTKLVEFSSTNDRLIFAGDLVNRGPQSLEVLDFCLKNKNAVSGVLGNHDFYLLYLLQHGGEDSSLNKIINSSNAEEYFNWLSALPLVKNIEIKNNIFWIVHAGIPPLWKPSIAYQYSQEIEDQLKNNSKELGNIPIELSVMAKGQTGIRIPELRGLSMRKAMNALNSKGIIPDMVGSGKVAWQNPSPGTMVQTGDVCKVGLK